jgi:uroporphyrinogen decarboxylase
MNRRDQVLKIINGEKPDYTPHHFDLTMKMTDRLAEYYGYDREGVEDFIGNHLLYLDPTAPDGKDNGFRSNTTDGVYKDEFGVVWDVEGNYDIGDWGMADFPVKDFDFSNYSFPEGKGEGRFDNATKVMEQYTGRFNVMRLTGPITLAWYIVGFTEFLMGMLGEKEKIHMMLDKVTEYTCNIISNIPKGVNAVRMIDDFGFQSGLMFNKDLWMEYVYPRYRKIHKAIRNKGMYVMQHTCGDVTELMPAFIELGVDILDAIQPESMDISFIKKEYGKDIVLFGGVGSQSVIPTGTPEEVVVQAENALEILGEGGKYILGPAGSIPTEAPIENVVALVDFCMKLKERGK